jgi:hypothetical protein
MQLFPDLVFRSIAQLDQERIHAIDIMQAATKLRSIGQHAAQHVQRGALPLYVSSRTVRHVERHDHLAREGGRVDAIEQSMPAGSKGGEHRLQQVSFGSACAKAGATGAAL